MIQTLGLSYIVRNLVPIFFLIFMYMFESGASLQLNGIWVTVHGVSYSSQISDLSYSTLVYRLCR